RIRQTAPYVPTPVAKGELLFLWSDKGVLSCIDADTGETHYRERVGGEYYGSPVWIGDHLYAMNTDGECLVVKADKKFELVAKNPLGEPSHATPAVANGTLYLRTFS